MTENDVKLDLSFIRSYTTQEEFCFGFADDLFAQWPELAEAGFDSHELLRYVLTNARNFIQRMDIMQANGTKKEVPMYQITISMLKDIQKDLEKRFEKWDNEHYDPWSKLNTQKTSDEDFKSVLHELTFQLPENEEKMFGYWIWQAINKLRGHFPEYPTFLGMVGKPGDGKDFTLGQFQLALGLGDESGLIPEGYSMSVLDSNFATRDFYSKGIIRFEEISARRKADIDTFKTVITNPKVEINEKYKMPFHFLSRNSYCGTANESYQCMINDTENRRIIEINWVSLKGKVSKKEVRNIFERLIACCPEEEIYDEDEILGYIHAQFDGDITIDKIWSCEALRIKLGMSSRIRVGEVKECLRCSFAEARKFLQDERYFEYKESGHYYNILPTILDVLNAD